MKGALTLRVIATQEDIPAMPPRYATTHDVCDTWTTTDVTGAQQSHDPEFGDIARFCMSRVVQMARSAMVVNL
jgi:hypothetical protein